MNLGIAFTRGGATVMFSEALGQFLYSGVIWQPASSANAFEGLMQDQIGQAELSEIYLSETELRFSKRYLDRHYLIHYVFRNKEEILGLVSITISTLVVEQPDVFYCQ